MQKNKFGFMLEDSFSKKLFILAKHSKKKPYEYLTSLIQKEYNLHTKNILRWDCDDD
jgi:hypothetical protein